ncbi:MAG: hypothetical protein HY360_07630 [Verrucomicrobia bacterium]|nr:hypothetical protein [Verrucomicrobiota bacterium]
MTAREALLRSLLSGDPRLTPEKVVYIDTLRGGDEPMTRAEFSHLLSEMETKGWILGVTDELEGTRKWKLTDKGRAVLLERS